VRFQLAILRFLPNAEDQLRRVYKLVYENPDLLVAVNMVGREDNERILRFEREMQDHGIAQLGPMPETRSFVCNRYGLCK
jgi:hypothetical protein